MVFRRSVLEEGVLFAEDIGYMADIEYYLHTCLLGDIAYDLNSRAFFRTSPAQASAVTGRGVTSQWAKVVARNRNLVAQRLEIPANEIAAATDEILARHRFIMTKPDRATFRRFKLYAAWRALQAGVHSPRLLLDYLRCRSELQTFLTDVAVRLTKQLTVKYTLP
jgi:hypothetical protein